MSLNLALYSTEIILVLTLCFALVIQMVSKNKVLTLATAGVGLLVALYDVATLYQYEPQFFFSSHLSHDPFSLFFKLVFIGVSLVTLLFGFKSYEIKESRLAEFYLLILSVTVGLCTLVSSVNLLTLYLSFELVSITSYALAGFRKENLFSNEASIKYLLYGAFASGTMLWGLSLLYGISGSLNLYSINATLSSAYMNGIAIYALFLMLLFGFAFKMAAAPFHMWAPDVYQGSPTPVAAFLTVAPKAAGFAFFIRVFFTVFSNNSGLPGQWVHMAGLNWPLVIAILSALTMTIGNLSALFQTNAKRLLAYSSIAHAGYMLMGIVPLSERGLASVLFYVVVYFLMNFGAFLIVGWVGNTYKNEKIDNFKGLGWKSPVIGVSMTIFLLSLTGIPPFGGFIGKVYLFSAVIDKEIWWLLLVAVINTVISLYYYAYLIRKMFLEAPSDDQTVTLGPLQLTTLLLLAVPTVVLGIYWEPLYRFVSSSLQFIVVP